MALSATGTLSNTATVAPPVGVTDSNAANDSATDVDTVITQADLGITKSDGQTTATPGESLTYQLTVTNAGPLDVTGATVTDTFPSSLTGCSWTCLGTGGASCTAGPSAGNVADSADLPVGGTAIYSITCGIDPTATGTLVNTATVAPPAGITDPVAANNSATDVNVLTPKADLAITKTDNTDTAVAGESITYVINTSNAGPVSVTGAVVTDLFPASLSCTWTCSGTGGAVCTAGPQVGDLNDTPTLPVGAVATYLAVCDVPSDASGSLANTATIATPAGITDPNTANNSATDVDLVARRADLAITKDNGETTVVPGTSTTYTVTVRNTGPGDVVGATVTDLFSSALTCDWTCAGMDDLSDTVDLPVLGEVGYTVVCAVDPGAVGTLSNTATVAAPAEIVDDDISNNSASDTDELIPTADLAITKNDHQVIALPTEMVTYTIEARNLGPSDALATTVLDTFPPEFFDCTWTCTPDGAAACTAGPEVGDLVDNPDLPAGDGAIYTATCSVAEPGTLTISNTATVSVLEGVTDPEATNNTATDLDDGLLAILFLDGFESGDVSG